MPDQALDADGALAALRASDPVLARMIDGLEPVDMSRWRRRWALDSFMALARGIAGQQIATGAATAIFDRLPALIGDRDPAAAIAEASDADLRTVGLSRAKAASLRDLAARTLRRPARSGRSGRDDRRRGTGSADRGPGDRPVDRGHVPARTAGPGRHPARRGPGHPPRGPGGVRPGSRPERRRGPRPRRGVAARTVRSRPPTCTARCAGRRRDGSPPDCGHRGPPDHDPHRRPPETFMDH